MKKVYVALIAGAVIVNIVAALHFHRTMRSTWPDRQEELTAFIKKGLIDMGLPDDKFSASVTVCTSEALITLLSETTCNPDADADLNEAITQCFENNQNLATPWNDIYAYCIQEAMNQE